MKFDDRGLVPVIAQDAAGGEVLMLAYANEEALRKTEESGYACFFSRSRNKLWEKGETSGNRLAVSEIRIDCDGDTLLYSCRPEGPACHTGEYTCFYRNLSGERRTTTALLGELEAVFRERLRNPDPGSYTVKMLQGPPKKIEKKILEEAFETVLASESADLQNLAEEIGDVWFHSLLLLSRHGLSMSDVLEELAKRRGKRRTEEKK